MGKDSPQGSALYSITSLIRILTDPEMMILGSTKKISKFDLRSKTILSEDNYFRKITQYNSSLVYIK